MGMLSNGTTSQRRETLVSAGTAFHKADCRSRLLSIAQEGDDAVARISLCTCKCSWATLAESRNRSLQPMAV